MFINTHHEEM